MEIVKVEIENFKSIGSKIRFDIENNFLCLLGKNNMGKTNILDAIEFMSNYSTKKYKDYCNFDNDGKPININLHFTSSLNKVKKTFFISNDNNNFYNLLYSELTNILNIIESKVTINVHKNLKNILSKFEKNINKTIVQTPYYYGYNNYHNNPINSCKDTLKEVITKYIEFFISNFLSNNKYLNEKSVTDNNIKFSFSLNKENVALVFLEIIESMSYENFLNFVREDFKKFYEKSFKWDDNKMINIIPIKDSIFDDILNILIYYISANGESLFTIKEYNNKIKLLFKNTNINIFFKVNKWRYSDNYIIPNKLYIHEFIQTKGNNCIPLLNLINGAKITLDDFNDIIDDHQKSARILGKLNKFSNDYLRNIWPDFKEQNLEFEFTINSEELITNIRNTNIFNHRSITSESDGVKQFLSIILSQDLEQQDNQIYLIDEPETHLHPSSVIAIRKYIQSISKKISIISTTHSMYMIDINSLCNYAIVEKDNKHYTCISNVENSRNISELLAQSFGIDIFSELMRPDYYMLVEGSIDEQVIKKIIESIKLNCFIISVGGTPNFKVHVEKYKKVFSDIFFSEKFFVFLDSDEAGIKAKNELINLKLMSEKNVFLSNEFIKNSTLNSIEDMYSDKDVEEMKKEIDNLDNWDKKKKYKAMLLKKNIDNLSKSKCDYFNNKINEKIKVCKDA